jgi:hypothetical protein
MSKLTDTKRAYDAITKLVDTQILKKGSNLKELQRFREALDVAFYLLGWSQFEYLVREEARGRIEEMSRSKGPDGRAWKFVQQNLKSFALRKKLEVIFHSDAKTLHSLNDDYDLRNDAAHNYAKLPREARDISAWLAGLEGLTDKFQK